jgi:hypothetical protein
MLMEMLIDYPIRLTHTHSKKLMRIPGMEKIHPLHSHLNLIACRLSGQILKTKEFQIKLPKSYWLLGEAVRKKQYATYTKRWLYFCSLTKTVFKFRLGLLTDLFESGLTYSYINCARSALSAFGIMFNGVTVGCNATIIRFLKGVYNLRPT